MSSRMIILEQVFSPPPPQQIDGMGNGRNKLTHALTKRLVAYKVTKKG